MDVNGVAELVTYGMAEFATSGRGDRGPSVPEISVTILEMCRQAKTKSKRASTALPTYAVFTSILSLPKMSKSDLKSAVRWEAKKVMPLPVEEMILDPQVLESNGPNGSERVLLTGAPRTVVQRY